MESRLPNRAAAAGKSGWSRTLRTPWSGTITAPITFVDQRSAVSSPSALAQSAGRLNVGMPTAMLALPGAGSVAYQPPLSRLTAVSVVMSNQIQPPSSNGLRRHLDLDDLGRLDRRCRRMGGPRRRSARRWPWSGRCRRGRRRSARRATPPIDRSSSGASSWPGTH